MRKLLYIAGPYRGKRYKEDIITVRRIIKRNIDRAREAAVWCAENDIYFFCPHLHTAYFERILPEVPERFWYCLDLQFLPFCDGIGLLENWDTSEGAKNELQMAVAWGKKVFLFNLVGKEEILKWNREGQ